MSNFQNVLLFVDSYHIERFYFPTIHLLIDFDLEVVKVKIHLKLSWRASRDDGLGQGHIKAMMILRLSRG